ncbi:MAG: hypothetical protein ACRDRX_04030 [Pseudonocardiaceae bacterium]
MTYHPSRSSLVRPLAAGWTAALVLLAVLAGCGGGHLQTTGSRSVTITGEARIPGHQVLTAGYPAPSASTTPRGTDAVQIVLTGLRGPVSAGLRHPAVFTFEQAGELRLALPVENPTRPRLPASQ